MINEDVLATTIDVRMPAEEREGTAAAVGKWLKQQGDAVQEHEPLLEINTDKVTMEIPSPASGILAEVCRQEGDAVQPGDLLSRIGVGAALKSSTGPIMQADPQRVALPYQSANSDEGLSPAVRRLLREHGFNAVEVPKATRGQRLTIGDVEAYLGSRSAGPEAAKRTGRRLPHTPMRKAIAAHMLRSVQTAPHVTSVFEADLSAVLRDREERKQHGKIPPSITAYLIRAAVASIRHVPEVNSTWHEGHLEIFDWINFGVGTALDTGGLVVPVIRDVHAMSLEEVSDSLRALTDKARAGKLTQADMEDGTFTLSNHGVSGSLLAAPIILPYGQAAILGAGKLQKRVIVCETGGRELFRVRPMMYVTLTVDHRILDGQQTNGFLAKFVQELESPASSREL